MHFYLTVTTVRMLWAAGSMQGNHGRAGQKTHEGRDKKGWLFTERSSRDRPSHGLHPRISVLSNLLRKPLAGNVTSFPDVFDSPRPSVKSRQELLNLGLIVFEELN